jgi:hypothetical protein
VAHEQAVTLTLTPSQWKALQELLALERHPPKIFPLSAGTINFDHYPLLAGPIPQGTDLTLNQPFALSCGVTFSADPGPGGVYTIADPSGRSPNIVTLRNSTVNPWFNAFDGAIRATFDPPARSVSIDALPRLGPEPIQECPKNQPYILALDATGNFIPGTEVLYPISGCVGTQQNPLWGQWQTLTINRSQADIHAVEFSAQQTQPGVNVYAVFDNLSFQR